MKKLLKSKGFIGSVIVGILIAGGVLWLMLSRGRDLLSCLCDGFFVAGILLLCYAGLVFSRNQGTFDIFSYGISHLFKTRWPGFSSMSEEHEKEKFADYRMRVSAKRKFDFGPLIAGGLFMVIAAILLVIYFI